VKPHYLDDLVLEGMFNQVIKYRDNIKKDIIFKGIKWI